MSIAHGSKEALRKRKKRVYELGSPETKTKVSSENKTVKSVRKGGNVKNRVRRAKEVNLLDPEKGKHQIVELKNVKENPANRNYPRENVVTKGAIIETSKGDARVTSRPGQDGTVNAVLIKEED